MFKRLCGVLGGVLFIALLWVLPLAAQRQSALATPSPVAPLAVTPAQIGFAPRSGGIAWMDNLTPCATLSEDARGPRAMWMAIVVTNTATETLTGVVAELSGLSSAYYALTADPARYVGNLAPGQTYHGYWYVDYSGACQANPPYGLTDTYTLTVTADNLSAPAHYTGALVTGVSQGVGAGVVETSFLGSAALAVGHIFTQVAQYKFPNNVTGMLLQPTGDAGFADTCFRLVGARIAASTVPGIVSGTLHQLYFHEALPKTNQDRVTIQYFWQAQCRAESTSTPWWTSTRGNPGPRYADNYGLHFSTFPTASLSLSITVSVTPTQLTAGGTVTYTLRLRNAFTKPIIANSVRFGLPAHVVYKGVAAASAVHPGNSSQYPALGATGALTWTGIPLLSYTVPASGTLTPDEPGEIVLIFTADAPAVTGQYTAVTTATVGTLEVGPLTTKFDVNLPTAVTLAAFAAAPQDDAFCVTWETALELDNAGFNLYRSVTPDGPYTRLNAALIPPQFPGEVRGGEYVWLDRDVTPGVAYYYRLEDVDTQGLRTFHGPVAATARLMGGSSRFTVFLPLVSNIP